jgi:hypothetical protein
MSLTEEQMHEKLEEVSKIKFFLDPDPTTLGLQSITIKLAEIQIQKDRVASLVMEGMRNLAELEIIKETVQHKHDRQLELLTTTEASCLAAKSAEARSIQARIKMPDLVMELHRADISHIKGNWYLKILQSLYSNLESANGNLSRQISVIQLSTNIGEVPSQQRGMIRNINL